MKKVLVGVAVSLFLGLAAAAQTPGPVAKIYVVKVKQGMEAKFEEAYKAHVDWHRQQRDSWAWEAWQFESGDRVGQYVVVTPGHHWSDFDARGEMEKADDEQAQATLLPLVESLEVWWTRAIPEVSKMPQGALNAAVARVTDYQVRPGKDAEFMGVLRKVAQVMADVEGRGPVIWQQNLTGPGGVYTFVEMFPDWASLTPPAKSVIEVIAGKLGALETAKLVETFSQCVERTEIQLVRYRKDLSYAPAP